MTITLIVSDKLFKKDAENRFQDFFDRVIVDIADNLSDDDSSKLCGRYEMETASLLKIAFNNGRYQHDEYEEG